MSFGQCARYRRRQTDRRYSLRQVATRVGIQPVYLSKFETEEVSPPSEMTTEKMATELDEDPDLLLALAGKVFSDLQLIIRERRGLFTRLIRQLRDLPEEAILRVTRDVRDGSW